MLSQSILHNVNAKSVGKGSIMEIKSCMNNRREKAKSERITSKITVVVSITYKEAATSHVYEQVDFKLPNVKLFVTSSRKFHRFTKMKQVKYNCGMKQESVSYSGRSLLRRNLSHSCRSQWQSCIHRAHMYKRQRSSHQNGLAHKLTITHKRQPKINNKKSIIRDTSSRQGDIALCTSKQFLCGAFQRGLCRLCQQLRRPVKACTIRINHRTAS